MPQGPVSAQDVFALTDHDGRAVSDRSWPGRFLLVFFGYTQCCVACPRALQRLTEALDELGPLAQAIQPLYITVDPETDSPERLRRFLQAWPRFTGLTGSTAQVEAAKAAFRALAHREGPAAYHVPQSAITHLLHPDGRHVDYWLDVLSPGEVAERLAERVEVARHHS